MSLGQTICRLRTAKGYSQSELAEMLGVSRQSVSKWETDSSAPDLENLIRLHEILEVSMDELILGKAPATVQPQPSPVPERRGLPGHILAGILLAGFGAILFVLRAGLLATPFLILALICLVCRRRCGLWCGWAAYGMALSFGLFFTRFAYGLDFGRLVIRLLLDPDSVIRTYCLYPFDLVVVLGSFALLLLLIGAAMRSFSTWRVAPSPWKWAAVALGGAAYLLLLFTAFLPPAFSSPLLGLAPLARSALLAVLLCAVRALRKGGKQPAANR